MSLEIIEAAVEAVIESSIVVGDFSLSLDVTVKVTEALNYYQIIVTGGDGAYRWDNYQREWDYN